MNTTSCLHHRNPPVSLSPFPPFSFSSFPLCLLVFALLAAALTARAADDLSATLQRGLFEEEANNNLPAAIKAYEAVINATDAQRKLAGTALFRLAECQRKLGRTNDAVALYQRVLREYADQTRLADLSRQYVVTTAPAELGGDLGTERVRLLEREFASQQAEYARLAALYRSLTNLTRPELKKIIPTAAPEPLLSSLQEQRLKAEQRLAGFPEGISPAHPDLLSAKASLKTIDNQIEERLDGIVAGIAVKVATQKALLDQSTKALDEARAGAAAPALSQSARAEQKRLLEEEIKIVEKDLAELEQQRKAGVVSAGALSAKQRELLALRRQVAALADVPSEASSGSAVSTPTDEEDKEVRRIQALIKDSPDLINAGGQGGSTPLHKAAGAGQLVVARFLLANKAAVNARRQENLTPLHDAVANGHKSMTELLLANGADVNAASSAEGTPLHFASGHGYKSIAEVLLANKANVNAADASGGTPLHAAVEKGFKSVAETLLASGAGVNALKGGKFSDAGDYEWRLRGLYGTALHMAVFDGNQAMTELLLAHHAQVNIANPFGETPLHLAAAGNNSSLAGLLLAAKADVNARVSKPGDNLGKTPLCYAVTRERAEMVEFLLKNGADPNVRFGADQSKVETPLAASFFVKNLNDRDRIALALLEHKADPNAKNGSGYAPLRRVMYYPQPKALAEMLLTNGTDVEVRDPSGNTPLCFMSGGREIIELLLDHKANPNAQNDEGNTPLHTLVQKTMGNERATSQKELAELLIARGADVNLRNRQGLTPLNLYGVPARPGYSSGEELAEVLRKHGAKDEQLDLVTDLDSIRVWRKGMTFGRVVFVRDEAGHNRFTLMEALQNFYSLRYTPQTVATRPAAQASTRRPLLPTQPGLAPTQPGAQPVMTSGGMSTYTYDPLGEFAFPDLTRIRILRLDDAAKNEKKVISVNLINAAGIVLCANDVLLEFGDIIEIPEREYRLDEGRSGLTGDQGKQFSECLQRNVQFVVKGEATEVKLLPFNTMAYLAAAMKLSPVRNVLRSTSDLSRLRITRRANPTTDQPAKELKVDLEAFQRSGKQHWDDLWLRDGDLIEVPERE
jgi:ankyrin repeat protein